MWALIIGSDRPSLKALHDHVVNSVAGKWKDLGVQLLPPDMVDIIAADHPHDVVSCCNVFLRNGERQLPMLRGIN